jgi:hypothetical protein
MCLGASVLTAIRCRSLCKVRVSTRIGAVVPGWFFYPPRLPRSRRKRRRRLRRRKNMFRPEPELPLSPELEHLKSLVHEQKIVPEDLDEMVHDLKSEEASRINNEGTDRQLGFLVESLGTRVTESMLREVARMKRIIR